MSNLNEKPPIKRLGNLNLKDRLLGEVVRAGSQNPDQENESEEEPYFVGATDGRHSNQTPLQNQCRVSQQYIGKAAEFKLTVSSETNIALPPDNGAPPAIPPAGKRN